MGNPFQRPRFTASARQQSQIEAHLRQILDAQASTIRFHGDRDIPPDSRARFEDWAREFITEPVREQEHLMAKSAGSDVHLDAETVRRIAAEAANAINVRGLAIMAAATHRGPSVKPDDVIADARRYEAYIRGEA